MVSTESTDSTCTHPVGLSTSSGPLGSAVRHSRTKAANAATLTLDIIKPVTGVGAPS